MRRCGPDTSEQPSGRRVGWAGGCSYLGDFKGSNVIVLNKVYQRPISPLIIACPGPSETMPPKCNHSNRATLHQVGRLDPSSQLALLIVDAVVESPRRTREQPLSPLMPLRI